MTSQTTKRFYGMYSILASLVDRLGSEPLTEADVIKWGSPVPCFGDPTTARVATLGLNPSNREFVDGSGRELEGVDRRFHTLASLGISDWSEADARHIQMILDSCCFYFAGNPYDRWFKRLDQIVVGADASFYDPLRPACHLDLIPYATARKWTSLSTNERSSLLEAAGDSLASLLRESRIRILILNGRSVVERFEAVTNVRLEREEMHAWSLGRRNDRGVMGFSYRAKVDSLSGIKLSKSLLVLGYNHNIQSSFGVTNIAIQAIQQWVTQAVTESDL